jgi:predicted nucleic acid-binding protein
MLIDTSALIGYFIREDLHWSAVRSIVNQLKTNNDSLDILDTVYEEALAVLRKRHSKAAAIRAAKIMIASSTVNLCCVGKNTLIESSKMFIKHKGKYSYVDCTLAVWAEKNGIKTIIAVDKHFSELGLIVIP